MDWSTELVRDDPFFETALLLLVASAMGLVARLLRQPLIVMLIAVGIIVGPSVLDWVHPGPQLELLANLGIAVLLFVVGLKLDIHLIRRMGRVALATGLGQVAFTSLVGFLIALALGWSVLASTYIAVALTFSSTIIIVNLLSDKRELEELHGRIAVGFLIVQDIVVVIVMIALSALGAGTAGEESSFWWQIGMVAIRGVLFLGAIALITLYVLPRLVDWVAGTPELLILLALSWGVGLAAVADLLGLSTEVGAFLGGVSLASTRYREAIAGRLTTVRDFLLLFFFVTLGAELELDLIREQGPSALLFALFVLVGNPLIVMAIMGFMGYRRGTGFKAGLTVAQISEFSLILGAMGVSLGHIGEEALGLITLVGLVTIAISVYMIQYSDTLLRWLSPWLKIFERRHLNQMEKDDQRRPAPDAILFGLGRFGGLLADKLRERGLEVLGVDFDPDRLRRFEARGFRVQYGDAEDPQLAESLPISGATWVIGAVPNWGVNLAMLHGLKEQGYRGKTAVPSLANGDVEAFRAAGVDLVLQPYSDSAEHLAAALGQHTPDTTRKLGQPGDHRDQPADQADQPPDRLH